MKGAQTTRDVVFARVGGKIMTHRGPGTVRRIGKVFIRVKLDKPGKGQVFDAHCASVWAWTPPIA